MKFNVDLPDTSHKPQNRKEMLIMAWMAIRDSIRNHSIDEIINAYLNFINIAVAEIPDDDFDKLQQFKLEPSFNDAKEDFLKRIDLVFPEQIYGLYSEIESLRKLMYLRRLQQLHTDIEERLKKSVNWVFSKQTASYSEGGKSG